MFSRCAAKPAAAQRRKKKPIKINRTIHPATLAANCNARRCITRRFDNCHAT
jgi:hypothetical protein